MTIVASSFLIYLSVNMKFKQSPVIFGSDNVGLYRNEFVVPSNTKLAKIDRPLAR